MNSNERNEAVKALVAYGVRTGLITDEETQYTANLLFDALKADPDNSFNPNGGEERNLESILNDLLDDAVARGVIDSGIASRDLFDTRLMSCLTPRPAQVLEKFRSLYKENPESATDYFYKLECDSDYIRRYRIAKDQKWVTSTPYGDIDITINLSKPEKDPKAIAAALNKKQDQYPADLLTHANEGYAGRLDHPARQNLRQIPLTLDHEKWYMQYSPYVYYNEHCIVLSDEARPMKIEKSTFKRLLEFIDIFPHYTVGSNADLPIVGGSILTHEHFQGGRYTFAMAKAPIREEITFKGYEDIEAGIVNWPMSCIRLDGTDQDRMTELCNHILTVWQSYTDPEAYVYAETNETLHNTITPIARKKDGKYEMDLVLRNNITTDEYPLGLFHPHNEYHHIKKENIGLIEVMGLAVLPARLLPEMEAVKDAILNHKDLRAYEKTASHAEWAEEITKKYDSITEDNMDDIIKKEIGIVFSHVLENAGIYKDTAEGHAAFNRFIETVNK